MKTQILGGTWALFSFDTEEKVRTQVTAIGYEELRREESEQLASGEWVPTHGKRLTDGQVADPIMISSIN